MLSATGYLSGLDGCLSSLFGRLSSAFSTFQILTSLDGPIEDLIE